MEICIFGKIQKNQYVQNCKSNYTTTTELLKIFIPRHKSTTELCHGIFQCEKDIFLRELAYNFFVHSDEIACRKSVHVDLEQAIND